MHTFKDNEAVEWTVKVNAITLGRVEDALGVSFSDGGDTDGPFIRIACDAMFAFRVAFVLCEPQCKERDLTDEQFSERLVGDALGRAQSAILEAIIAFMPSEQRRKAARQVVDSLRAVEDSAIKHSASELSAIDIDAAVKEAISA